MAPRAGASVAIGGLVVTYPGADRRAVDDVTLDVAPGELVVLLGPSGCGKSTLLRSINRLVLPDAGTIEVDGTDVRTAAPETLRRGIGYVIQAVGLFPHMTVARNVAIVPGLLGWDRARRRSGASTPGSRSSNSSRCATAIAYRANSPAANSSASASPAR
ncbi:MAG: hypothetical protein NVS3B16_04360 [Vulcanimicrobiaceae bacterium]